MNEEINPENMRIHSRADELIACLEGEIAKRDARMAELEQELQAGATAVENCELFHAELAAIKAPARDITAMVDAAMIEMANISPPMRRSECERLIRAALNAAPVAKPQGDHIEDVRAMVVPSIAAAYAMGAKGGSVVDAERLAFESWMAGHCWALCAAWDGTGYRCESEQAGQFSPAAGMTRRLWAAWRDRAAMSAGKEGE